MLNIAVKPKFSALVGISVPGESNPVMITIRFNHQPPQKLSEYLEEKKGMSDVDLLFGIIDDWKNVDQDYSKDALAALLQSYPLAAREILDAYIRELTGSKIKN